MKKILIILTSIVMVLSSCSSDSITPASSGRPYEMLVLADKNWWENTEAGRALFDVLDTDVPGLPQSERSFRISNVSPENFKKSFKIFRNIIEVDIQDTYTQPKIRYYRDVYSTPQIIMRIQSPNDEEFAAYVTAHAQEIIDFFVRTEMNRYVKLLERNHSDIVTYKVDSIFGSRLWVPSNLTFYKVGEDFFWGSTNTATNDLNIVVYSYPYTDTRTFTRDFFVQKRDSVMKRNIPGSREGMYVYTDTLYVTTADITVHKAYAQEVRGLWAMKDDMMGGPFVSHSRVDEKNQRVVVVEGFVYSPDKRKRDLIRNMEASLYTLMLPQELEQDEQPAALDEPDDQEQAEK